jgi:hypothetical protein
LERHGQTVLLRTAEGEETVRAFLQPVTARDEQVPSGMSGIGWLDGRRWQYLGQAAVRAGDTLVWNGMMFRVRSSRAYAAGETELYWWATLEQEAE